MERGPECPVLVIAGESPSTTGAVVGRIEESLRDLDHDVIYAGTAADGCALVASASSSRISPAWC